MSAPVAIKAPNGIEYRSKKAMCEDYGVWYHTYIMRIHRGASLVEALGLKKLPNPLHVSVVAPNGIEYASQTAMCKAYGINPVSYRNRKSSGWTVSESLGLEPRIVESNNTNKFKKSSKNIVCPKGVVYSSEKAMCKGYGVNQATYRTRLEDGWSIEEALGIHPREKWLYRNNPMAKKIVAPDGVEYTSLHKMCKAYGVDFDVFRGRRDRGMSLEDCLSSDLIRERSTIVVCHKGVTYPSIKAMCDAYAVSTSQYRGRIKNGYSTQDALEFKCEDTEEKRKENIKARRESKPDILYCPNGLGFKDNKKMCLHYGVAQGSYKKRIAKGWTEREALGIDPSPEDILGPDGKRYSSYQPLADAYGINRTTLKERLRSGWSLTEALEKDVRHTRIVDHLGDLFDTRNQMCDYWGISVSVYAKRLSEGWSLEKILTTPTRNLEVVDHLGESFASKSSMCAHWGIDTYTYTSRLKKGWSVKDSLTVEVEQCLTVWECAYELSFLGVTLCDVSKVLSASYSSLKWHRQDLLAYVRDKLLWQNPDFLGYTDDDQVIARFDGVVAKMSLSDYLEKFTQNKVENPLV